jgi:hypothetical protein
MFFVYLFSTCLEFFFFVLISPRVFSVIVPNLSMTIITKWNTVVDVIASFATDMSCHHR